MPTHVQLAVQLLREAATFFRNVGEQNAPIRTEMDDNASVYERVADLLHADPAGEIDVEADE